MIPREATKEVLEELVMTGQFEEAIDDDGDFVYISTLISNAGSISNIVSCDYTEEASDEAESDGDLYIDKDAALRLIDEFGIDLNRQDYLMKKSHILLEKTLELNYKVFNQLTSAGIKTEIVNDLDENITAIENLLKYLK